MRHQGQMVRHQGEATAMLENTSAEFAHVPEGQPSSYPLNVCEGRQKGVSQSAFRQNAGLPIKQRSEGNARAV